MIDGADQGDFIGREHLAPLEPIAKEHSSSSKMR